VLKKRYVKELTPNFGLQMYDFFFYLQQLN
jgi:hypothetical protein